MFKKVLKILLRPKMLILRLLDFKVFNFLPDDRYLKIKYRLKMNKKLNINNPKTFNEKIQWLKLYDRNPKYSNLVDKFEVRKYVANIIGDEYLVPLIGVWDSFEEINFSELPKQFVLKCTHDSGGVVICTDKDSFDIKKARKKLNKSLKNNYYHYGREWPYKNIKPRIICEKYIEDDSNVGLIDYKFLCFNNEVKCSFLCLNRSSTGLNVDFYDLSWNPMPFERHYPKSNKLIPKPKSYNKMIDFSIRLSKNIPLLRVDFYEVKGKLYFGELTFYPGSGWEEFIPDYYDYKLGEWLELPLHFSETQ